MKIRKITFKNIHSLKGQHEVEFSEGVLSEAGLFLITGPTGSGKSTLLDIITLALYNRIPRIDSSITNNVLEQDGGIMTRNAKDCFAEVEYSINGDIYRSHWSIERNRNNNLNTRQQELTKVDSGDIIESGSSVPNKNEEIIGLSYDQFVKAMVLSQGQFSKLLKSTRDERNKLLEDITGAKIYRDIGKAVFTRFSDCKKARDNQDIKIGEIVFISDEDKTALETELKQLELASPITKKNYDDCKEKIEVRNQLDNQKELYNKSVEDKRLFEEQLKAFKDTEQALVKHNKLVQYRDVLNSEKQNREALTIIKSEKTEVEENLKGALNSKKQIEADIIKLIGKTCAEENLLTELEAFRRQVVTLRETENKTNSIAVVHRNALEPILKDLSLELKASPELTRNEIQTKQTQIEDIIAASRESSSETLEAKIVKLRKDVLTAVELTNAFSSYIQCKTTILNKQKDFENGVLALKAHQSKIKELQNEIKLLRPDVELLSKQAEEKKKLQSLEDHRNQLEKDQACPLCGSKEHPYATSLPVFKDQTESLLDAKSKLLRTSESLLVAEETLHGTQVKNNTDLEKENLGLEKTLKDALEKVDLLCEKLDWKNITEPIQIERNKNDLNSKLEVCLAAESAFKSQKIITQALKLVNDWESALNDFNKAKTEREQLYKGLDIDNEVSVLAKQFNAIIGNIGNYKTSIEKLQNSFNQESKTAEEFKTKLDAILLKEGIDSIESLKISILNESEAEAIRVKLKEYEQKRTSIETTIKLISESISKLKEKDDESVAKEKLAELFDAAKIEWENLVTKIAVIKEKLDADEKSRARHKVALENLEALKKDENLWKTMNNLVGDATGKKFSNFVQDLTLEQLIGFANIRLKEFSDRYILDIPTANEADKNDSLKVFDTHMGDVRRSVNTLSGGETFMLSLAMAFALSDLASRNVSIESIFIDEGFGTLDSDTLNQAISILEKMQNEGNKSIGIISHVEALKERITTQIKLEKSGAGYSSIRIE